MSFGKIGKGRRKSKNLENLSTDLKDVEDKNETARNENGIKENGNGNEETPPWKLPGIGMAPKLQSRASLAKSSASDSLLTERSLPPVPVPKPEASDSKESLESRELPPIPNSDPDRPQSSSSGEKLQPSVVVSSPEVPAGDGNAKDVEINAVSSNASPSVLNKSREENLETRAGSVSPFSNTPPTSVDSNSSRKQFRPLPPTPHLSDDDDDFIPSGESPRAPSGTHAASSEDTNTYSEPLEIGIDIKKQTEIASLDEPQTLDATEADVTTNKEPSVSSLASNSSSNPAPPATQDTNEETQSYTVRDIVTTYSYALPVRVRILQGYCSDTTEVNISTDDIYNIHSVQHAKKIKVKDEDGMTHCIPIDAPVKVGLVYNPDNDYDKSLNGYDFKTVSEISSLTVMPKLISATQAVNSNDDKNGVAKGEIFIVKSVQRSMFKGKKGLKVVSLATGSNKVLFDDCQGYFSTKPSLVRMDLTELLERVGDLFPSCAVLYPTTDDNYSADFPGTLSRVVTLLESNSDTTLVVSDVSFLEETELEEANLLPVPTTSPTSFSLLLDDDISMLEVAVLRWTYPEDQEVEHLYDDTTEIGLNKEPFADVSDIAAQSPPGRGTEEASSEGVVSGKDHTYVNLQQQQQQAVATFHSDQAAFHSDDWTDKEKMFFEEDEDAGYDTVGLHLLRNNPPEPGPPPPSMEAPTPNHGYSSVTQNLSKRKTSEEKPLFPSHNYSTLQNRMAKKADPPASNGYSTVNPHQTLNGMVVEVPTPSVEESKPVAGPPVEGGGGVGTTSEGDQLSSLMDSLESRLKLFQTAQQSAEMTKMQSMIEMLTSKLETVDCQLNSLTSAPPVTAELPPKAAPITAKDTEKITEKGSEESNRDYLKSLDVEQVGQLLEAMSLGQYKQKILDEQISGEILMECDESILVEEIGVVSRIHRIRLMKVIRGQHAVRPLLEKKQT